MKGQIIVVIDCPNGDVLAGVFTDKDKLPAEVFSHFPKGGQYRSIGVKRPNELFLLRKVADA